MYIPICTLLLWLWLSVQRVIERLDYLPYIKHAGFIGHSQ